MSDDPKKKPATFVCSRCSAQNVYQISARLSESGNNEIDIVFDEEATNQLSPPQPPPATIKTVHRSPDGKISHIVEQTGTVESEATPTPSFGFGR